MIVRSGALSALIALAVLIGNIPNAPAADNKHESIIGGKFIPKADGPVSPPALEGPDEAEYLAVVRVTGVAATVPIFWSVTPDETAEAFEPATDPILVFAGPAATYKVRAQFAIEGKKQVLEKKIKLTGSGVAPTPTPVPPGPAPKPQPPAGEVARFVVVEDTSKPGKWRGEVLGSPKVKSFYRQLQRDRPGSIHAIYDISTKPENLGDEGRKFVGLAVGKELPYIWVLDAKGAVIKEQSSPKEPDAFIAIFDLHPGERSFGLVIEAPKLKWSIFGASEDVPMVDRAQWPVFMSMSAFLPPVYDQDGIGECASSAACGLYEFTANQAGASPVHVSAGDLYRRVNGGRDNGSTLEDNMVEMLERGVSPVSTAAPYVWDRRAAYPGTDRSKHRFAEVYLCKSFDAAVSAITQGFGIEIGISWYGNYKPDKNGVLPKKGVGSSGGHALFCYGVVKLPDGTWGLLTRNSWGMAWGGSSDGTVDTGSCIIPESAFTGYIGGFFAVRSVVHTTKVTVLNPFRRGLQAAGHVLAF